MKITDRKAWGSRPRKALPTVAMSRRTEFIVHHSGGPADQSVRQIQDWCVDGRGFLDIDYNFLVRGTTGEIYEGRGWSAIGSHTVGHNTAGIGVCVIGNDVLTEAAQESVRWLYDQACERAGRPLKIYGHRDLDQTTCPGDDTYRWVHRGGIVNRPHKPARDLHLAHPYLKGPDVHAVQLVIGVTADSIYGPDTAEAVKRWQHAHGLTPDGIVGPKTRRAMRID